MKGKGARGADTESQRPFVRMASDMAEAGLIEYEHIFSKAGELRTMPQEDLSSLASEIVERNEKKSVTSGIGRYGFYFGLVFLLLVFSCCLLEDAKKRTMIENMGIRTLTGRTYDHPGIPDYESAVLRLAHNDGYIDNYLNETDSRVVLNFRGLLDRIALDRGIVSALLGALAAGASALLFLSTRGAKRIVSLFSCLASLYVLASSVLWLRSISPLAVGAARLRRTLRNDSRDSGGGGFESHIRLASDMAAVQMIRGRAVFDRAMELDGSTPERLSRIQKKIGREKKIRSLYQMILRHSFWLGLACLLALTACYYLNERQVDMMVERLPEEYIGGKRVIHDMLSQGSDTYLFWVAELRGNPNNFGEIGEWMRGIVQATINESTILLVLMGFTLSWMFFTNREREASMPFLISLAFFLFIVICYRLMRYYVALPFP